MNDTLFDDMADDLAAMRRYARALCRDASHADDLVQDALLKALQKRADYRAESSRKAWLLAIVHNSFVSDRRRRQAEAARDRRFAESLLDAAAPDREQQLRLAEIALLLAALPEAQREVLHLVVVEGLSYRQAADVLQVPIGTVMSRLSRARAAMRQHDAQPQQPLGLRIVGGRDED